MNKSTATDLPKLAAPAQMALARVGIERLEDCTKFTEDEIMHLHGMGPNALRQIRQALSTKQLFFAKSPKTS
jgi:hypothetical protein